METKVCTKCGIEKILDNFSPLKTGKDGIRSNCKSCASSYTKDRYKKKYSLDPEYKKRKSSSEKIRRQTPEYKIKFKAVLKEWCNRPENIEKWKDMRKKYKKKSYLKLGREYYNDYEKQLRDNLDNNYIIGKLCQKTGLKNKDIKSFSELIELKRNQIKIKRALKNK